MTGKEARKLRSARIKEEIESEAPAYDDDFYKWTTIGEKIPFLFCFFSRLQGRVDRMEGSIAPLAHKIDIVLSRLDSVFKKRKLKKEDLEKIFNGIVSNEEGML